MQVRRWVVKLDWRVPKRGFSQVWLTGNQGLRSACFLVICVNKSLAQTMAIIYLVLMVVRIHQHAKFQAILSMRSPAKARKPQIWPVLLSKQA